jgi:multiple sugar transport system permease protein
MSGHAGRSPGFWRLVAIGVTLIVLLSPFLWLLQMSFKSNDQILQFPPLLIFKPTLENYASLWRSAFSASFLNSS